MEYFQSFIFGIALAVSIGPIALIIIASGIQSGYRAAMTCALGAGLADFLLALLGFNFGVFLIDFLGNHQKIIRLGSTTLLFFIAFRMIIKGFDRKSPIGQETGGANFGFVATFFLTIVNPLTILVFWAFFVKLGVESDFFKSIILAICLFSGSMFVQAFLAFFGSWIRNSSYVSKNLKYLNFIGAAILLLFAF